MATSDDSGMRTELRTLLRSAGLSLAVEVEHGAVTLTGLVLSDDERQAALDLAGLVPGVLTISDELEVAELADESSDILFAPAVGDEVTNDPMRAAAEGIPYFPPTDPPVEPGLGPDGARVADGFLPTAMDDDEAFEGEELLTPGGKAGDLVDRIVLELAEDAMTSHLNLYVSALGGMVVLGGVVQDDVDAEAAVAVAERVEGVDQVVDRTVLRRRLEPATIPSVSRERPLEMAHVVTGTGVWRATVIANQFRLRDEREQVAEQIDALERDLQAYGQDQAVEGHAPTHNADLASDMAAAETIVAELELMRGQAAEIDDTLERVARGTYGICENCGRLIDRTRLKALPLARYDIRCQELLEERGEV